MNPLEDDLQKLASRSSGEVKSAERHRESLRSAVLAAFDGAPTHSSTVSSKTHQLLKPGVWRTIMRHPASRAVAVVMFAAMAAGIVWLFAGGGAHVAYADLVDPLLNAKTATFNITMRSNGKEIPIAKAYVSGSSMRLEMSKNGKSQIDISDGVKRQTLSLDPQTKQAVLIRAEGEPTGGEPAGMLDEIRKFLTPSNDQKGITRKSLSEREIDGRKLVGYRVSSPGMTVEIWADPKTLLPSLLVQQMTAFPSVETRMSDFQFDMELDPSLFSLDPPADYEVTERTIDVSPPTEEDLINGLRAYVKRSGGLFPDALNSEVAIKVLKTNGSAENGESREQEEGPVVQEEETMRRAFAFPILLGPEGDVHYAGKDVKFNAKDRPILWYKPKGGKTYRVIYADLTTKEVKKNDPLPNVPGAMRLGNPPQTRK